MRRSIIALISSILVTLALVSPALAHPGEPGERPTVFSGPPPTSPACVQIYQPVHDARGTVYTNAHCAFTQHGVRVTWDIH